MRRRRRSMLSLLLVAALIGAAPAGCSSTQPPPQWRLAWRSETVFGAATTSPMTCRLAAKLAGTGSQVRVEFTSPLGDHGYRLLAAGVARAAAPGSLDEVAGSQHALLFGGRAQAEVAPGTRVWSDPVKLSVRPGDIVAVTLSVSAGDAARKAVRTEPFACSDGLVPLRSAGSAFDVVGPQAWVRSILIQGPPARSVVAIGDSLTENALLDPPASYRRWTDVLLDRGVAIVNAGVGGGELTGIGVFGSIPGLIRIDKALQEPSVTDLIVCLGTNDLAAGVTADTLLTGMRRAIAAARNAGVHIWVATIPPRGGTHWDRIKESRREQVNAALRGSFLGDQGARLVDMDAAVRDPLHPTRLLPRYDGGDHLHLNAAGERAFALAVARTLHLTLH